MNELDLIRSFRSEMPEPSAAASARAERAWRRGEPRRPRWAPRAAVAAGLVAAATAAALIVPSKDDSQLGTQSASAAGTLRQAAAAQVGAPARPLRSGEYWYVRRRTQWPTYVGDRYAIIQPQVREDWVGVDGARHWRIRQDGEPRFPGPRDRQRWEEAGRPVPTGPAEHRVRAPGRPPFYDGAKAVTYAQLLALPRDPEALYRRMHDAAVECECGNGVDEETFVIAGDLLRDNPIPADLRAAILRAAALIPGIELIQDVRDVAGRGGVGVAFDGTGGESVLVFDPKTYELLGENDGLGGSADLESAIVESPDALP